MSTEATKEISRRWNEEFFNQRQVDAIDRFLHPDYVSHSNNIQGLAAAREAYTKMLEDSPDLHLQIEDVIAEGDQVVTRWTMRTGEKAWAGISIERIVDGKIAEDWFHATEVSEA